MDDGVTELAVAVEVEEARLVSRGSTGKFTTSKGPDGMDALPSNNRNVSTRHSSAKTERDGKLDQNDPNVTQGRPEMVASLLLYFFQNYFLFYIL